MPCLLRRKASKTANQRHQRHRPYRPPISPTRTRTCLSLNLRWPPTKATMPVALPLWFQSCPCYARANCNQLAVRRRPQQQLLETHCGRSLQWNCLSSTVPRSDEALRLSSTGSLCPLLSPLCACRLPMWVSVCRGNLLRCQAHVRLCDVLGCGPSRGRDLIGGSRWTASPVRRIYPLLVAGVRAGGVGDPRGTMQQGCPRR